MDEAEPVVAGEFKEVSPEQYRKIAARLKGAFIQDGLMYVETAEGIDSIGYVDKHTHKHMVRVK